MPRVISGSNHPAGPDLKRANAATDDFAEQAYGVFWQGHVMVRQTSPTSVT
jgi:hypothetical protein